MNVIAPKEVLELIANATPSKLLGNITIVGSLATAYHFFGNDENLHVRTKDVDSVLLPRSTASNTAEIMLEQLLASGWTHKTTGHYGSAGTATTPAIDLPAPRLYPPGTNAWFLELLTAPEPGQTARGFLRIQLSTGHYGLPSFQYLGIATHQAKPTPYGLSCARVENMALANLLEHDTIRPDTIADTNIKRSNKDLGRVLAIARLAGEDTLQWSSIWLETLQVCFPDEWRVLAKTTGNGLRQLLDPAYQSDLIQATTTCNTGLLAAQPTTTGQLKVSGQRLIQDAVQPLEQLARDV